ncbi:MAG: hypothetical protein ABW277_09135 [Longimicrobiaceae bacterium]
MRRSNRKPLRGAVNALMLGAIGLGAGQALAAPPEASAGAAACSAYELQRCVEYCDNLHGPGNSQARCTQYAIGPRCSCILI